MKLLRPLIAVCVLALGAGCGAKKKKEITDAHRNEAKLHVSEAQFALSVRDWARAETLLAKAADLTPDVPGLWLELGTTRMRLKQRDGAKAAYKEALSGYEESAKNRKNEPQWVFEQVKVLLLLGRESDARSLLEKMPAQFPDNREVKSIVDSKPIDRMVADPKFKEVML